jgi:hypothetical protein
LIDGLDPTRRTSEDGSEIWPWREFLEALWGGRVCVMNTALVGRVPAPPSRETTFSCLVADAGRMLEKTAEKVRLGAKAARK